ncbi:MAG: S9 family peptidase, partial [Alphaproteobacteria bacterium]
MFDLSQAPTPPKAKKVPSSESHHGFTRNDDYGWLRVDNWMEVMANPAALDPEVRAYLEAENDYSKAVLAPTQALQERLFNEIKGRIKEDDQSPPTKDGPFAYYVRFRTGGQYPIHCRKDREDTTDASEQILFDGDAEAKGYDYFRLAGSSVSDDHSLMAWAVDTKG